MQTAIEIGASKEAVKEAKVAILDIIKSQNGDDVKREALITLRTICQVNGTSISHCTFTGK